jgi:hypothetical protein
MQDVDPILRSVNPHWFYMCSDTEIGLDLSKQNTLPPRRAEEIRMALTSDLKDFIASGFASVPEVERVYTLRHPREHVVYVRVVVARSDRTVRDRIYAKEKQIIDAFDTFDFDFGIVSSPESVDPTLKLAYRKV